MSRQSYNTRYKSELSPRQREVLDLIARGKTNTEIGVALGISLDGAKYHVSEVLAKVGVSTREEAAARWREQNRPMVWLKARIAGIPLRPLFLATGFGGGLACAAAAVVLFFPGFGDDGHERLPPCPVEAVQMRGGTSLGDKSSDVTISLSPMVVTQQACAIEDHVTVTISDRTRLPLNVAGNPVNAPVHLESRLVAFVLDADREPVLVTPGPSMPRDVQYAVSNPSGNLSLLWTNWCGSYAGPVTVTLGGERYPADEPAYISNPPRCLDPTQPSMLRLVSQGG